MGISGASSGSGPSGPYPDGERNPDCIGKLNLVGYLNMDLPAGRALDKLVAETVMGQVWQGGSPVSNCDGQWPWPPPYSTDISAAWKVVEHLLKENWFFDLAIRQNPLTWRCVLIHDPSDLGPRPAATADECETAPLAICRAALASIK